MIPKNGTSLETLLEDQLPQLMAAAKVPGLSIALISEAQVSWSRGFGFKHADTQEPVTADTVFEAASLSKPLFAYAVLKLCEDGTLDLDTPLSAYLPEPYLPDAPRLHLITARHVLCHTPGFPNWRPEGEPLTIDFVPGERFSYSGEGYVYLQHVVEHLTDQPLAVYLQVKLLRPLAMPVSSYVWLDAYETQAARGHDEAGQAAKERKMSQANAAYSLYTTPAEFAQLALAMMPPFTPDPFRLSEAATSAMLTPQVKVNDRLSWGLGWGLQHNQCQDAFWHWGDNGVFKAFVMGCREQRNGVVLMTNGQNGHRLWGEVLRVTLGGVHPAVTWLKTRYYQ